MINLLKKKKSNVLDDVITYTIDDLKKEKHNNNLKSDLKISNKSEVSVLIIDDNGYDIEPLKQLGYRDVEISYDFEEMIKLKKYNIIFCDINEVASKIYPIGQGAQLASKIKKEYPEKMVIIFSAQSQKLSFSKYYNSVDKVIDKLADYETISEIIDEYIETQNDPIKYWEAMKKQMLKQNISTLQIAKMEHYYVKSFLQKNNCLKEYISCISSNELGTILSFAQIIISSIDLFLKIIGK